MDRKIVWQMREVEEILVELVRTGRKFPEAVMRPVQIDAARILVELYKIEATGDFNGEEATVRAEELLAAVHENVEDLIENKQAIANKLLKTLQLTRAGSDIELIEISEDKTKARITWKNGHHYDASIEADSGIAMIKDICRAI